MSKGKSILPANAVGILAVVVVGSMVANRMHGLMLKAEAKVKELAAGKAVA